MPGPHHEGERAKVAAMLGAGVPLQQIVQETGVHRATIWDWRTHDPEFQQMLADVVEAGKKAAAKRLEGLADLAVDAFERGLRSTHRQQAMKVAELVQVVDLEDNSLAVRTADIVTRRIPELMPREGLDIDLGPAEKLAALIRSLDERDDQPGPDEEGPATVPPGPPPLRPDQPSDPDQAS